MLIRVQVDIADGSSMYRERLSERPFDQMLVNEYEPGQGIAFHRDHKPFKNVPIVA